jgi:hypothetical protein
MGIAHVAMDDSKRVLVEVLDRAGVNPRAFARLYVANPSTRDALTFENPRTARWV